MPVLDLSCPESTPAGRLIGEMIYGGLLDVLRRDEYECHPHEGMQHQLHLYLSADDTLAFLSLIEIFFEGHKAAHWPERVRHFQNRTELLLMGACAPILDVLSDFREGPNYDWALREIPLVQAGLKSEGKNFETLGDMATCTSGEISGPQCRYAGNKSKVWMGWVMKKFKLEHQLSGC